MGNRRLHRHATLLAIAAAVMVITIAGLWKFDLNHDRSDVAPVRIRDGCPAVIPGTSNGSDDYADMFSWDGTFFVQDGTSRDGQLTSSRLSTRVGVIVCSLAEGGSTNGMRIADRRWPNGVATGLPKGTELYAVPGRDPSCVLGVRSGRHVIVYSAWDFATDPSGC